MLHWAFLKHGVKNGVWGVGATHYHASCGLHGGGTEYRQRHHFPRKPPPGLRTLRCSFHSQHKPLSAPKNSRELLRPDYTKVSESLLSYLVDRRDFFVFSFGKILEKKKKPDARPVAAHDVNRLKNWGSKFYGGFP